MKKDIVQRLREGRVIIDGSMGALLSEMGVEAACPDLVGAESPQTICGIHRAYLDAGADIVITDTFGSSPVKLGKHGLRGRIEEIVGKAVENARAEAGEEGFVALDVGPTGDMLYPMGTLHAKDAIAGYREQIRAGKGADFALMETMTDIGEGRTGMLAAKEEGMPFAASFSFEASGRTMTGGTPECAAIIAKALGALAVGMNCSGGPELMVGPLRKMRSVVDLPIIVEPNAGLPEMVNGKTTYPFGPERFVQEMRPILEAGAAAVGGCCGTTPEHIRLLALAAKEYPAAQPIAEEKTYVCSSRKYAELGDALENKELVDDIDDLYDIEDDTLLAVIDLRESDAEDAAEDIAMAVTATHAPLGFIAEDAEVLEAALRAYVGVAAVCAPDSCAAVIEKYGAVRVGDLG
ncbi:MAG: homocysteine S-methyltransferase family protein [Eubacteriales bacterium]|nr:homocysteine S-methyltransferase family protein [Eubacteriales bacterium]